MNKRKYIICEECGATDSCKEVNWEEYKEIKKQKGLYGVADMNKEELIHNYSGKSLLKLRKYYGVNPEGFYDNDWWLKEDFAKETPEKGKYTIVLHEDWNNMNYQEQNKKLKEVGEEWLHPAILAEAILEHYKKTGERLLEKWYSRTNRLVSYGPRVYLGRFASDGLLVAHCWDDGCGSDLGLVSSRKTYKEFNEITINGQRYKLKKNMSLKKEEIKEKWGDYFVSIGGGTALNSEEEVVAQKECILNWWFVILKIKQEEIIEMVNKMEDPYEHGAYEAIGYNRCKQVLINKLKQL